MECVLILDRFICMCYPTWSCDLLFYSKQMLRYQAPLISAALTPESLVQKYFCVNFKTCSFLAVSDEAVQTRAIPKQTQLLEIPTTPKVIAERRCYGVWKAELTEQPVHPITLVCWSTRQQLEHTFALFSMFSFRWRISSWHIWVCLVYIFWFVLLGPGRVGLRISWCWDTRAAVHTLTEISNTSCWVGGLHALLSSLSSLPIMVYFNKTNKVD